MAHSALPVREVPWAELPPAQSRPRGPAAPARPRLVYAARRRPAARPRRAWLRGPADPNAVLTIMILPHSTATPWVWRLRARVLHLALVAIVGLSVVAVGGVLTAHAERGSLRLVRSDLTGLRGVRSAAAAQASAVDAQAQVLDGQAAQLTALGGQVQALLAAQQGLGTAAGGTASAPGLAGDDQNLAAASAALQALNREIPQLQSMVGTLGQEMAGWSAAAAQTPSIWPVLGPITSPFGERLSPTGGEGMQFHSGVDIGVPSGTPVHVTAAGAVVFAGWDPIYGWAVRVDNGGGLETLYGHNSRLLVSVGDAVTKGQVVSLSGSTGISTGPHVHYEIDRNGTPINPMPYLPGNG